MTDVQLTPVDEDILDTILAADVDFTGTLSFTEPLMIKGRVVGSVCTESDLYIDEKAYVQADIVAHDVAVRGTLKGNIRATGRVELFASCTVHGDVRAAEVAMESGCHFNGVCTMTGKVNAAN
jgi:cytoskeletal protein CcmA (bactofilin family)